MIDGVYNISVVAMGQERSGEITFKTDGEKLSGVLNAMGHTFEFDDGKATENSFDLAFRAQGQKFVLKGTVDESGHIDGEGKMGFIPMVLIGDKAE